jgi:ribonucleotide monophosphatase NagD (HAD superfamily)
MIRGVLLDIDDIDGVLTVSWEALPGAVDTIGWLRDQTLPFHRNARYQTADGPALDMGAFTVGLEVAAGVEVEVVGKPAATFFRTALDDLAIDHEEAVMVGDSPPNRMIADIAALPELIRQRR